MATDPQDKPSFSAGRRWGIGLNLLVRTLSVLALVVMANYLSGHYFKRAFLSSQTRTELSPLTVRLLKSLTNDVKVTLYTRAECGLCAEAEEALLRVRKLIQFEAELVYIEDDDELYERYSQRVPVVVVDGKEVASAPVDEARLQAVLSSAV